MSQRDFYLPPCVRKRPASSNINPRSPATPLAGCSYPVVLRRRLLMGSQQLIDLLFGKTAKALRAESQDYCSRDAYRDGSQQLIDLLFGKTAKALRAESQDDCSAGRSR